MKNRIQHLQSTLACMILMCVSLALNARQEILTEYKIPTESPLLLIFNYISESAYANTDSDQILFEVHITFDHEYQSPKISVSEGEAELLSYGVYIGYIKYDNCLFFINTSDARLFKDACIDLMENNRHINVEIRDHPIEDGIGPEWVFLVRDCKVYFLRYYDGKW